MKNIIYWKPEAYKKIQKKYQFKNGLHLISQIKKVTILKNKKILDIGCGFGNLTFQLYKSSKKTAQIDAVDIDKNMINYAIKKYKINNIKFYNQDIVTFLKSNKKKYEIIFSNAAIHWLNNIEFKSCITIVQREIRKFNVPVFLGIFPMKSYGIAKGFDTFVPGVDVPKDILARWKRVKTDVTDKKEQKEMYDQLNFEFFKPFIIELKSKGLLSGVHCMAVHYTRIFPKLVEVIKG